MEQEGGFLQDVTFSLTLGSDYSNTMFDSLSPAQRQAVAEIQGCNLPRLWLKPGKSPRLRAPAGLNH